MANPEILHTSNAALSLSPYTSNMQILIADSHERVRYALRVMLSRQTGLTVVGEASSWEALLRQVQETQPDLVLVDLDLLCLAEASGLAALRRTCPGVRVVALSSRPDACPTAAKNGADAFVSKGDPPERLLAMIRRCSGSIC